MSLTTSIEEHCLTVKRKGKKVELSVSSLDSNHAQAQAADICRALEGESFSLSYKERSSCYVSELFKRLAFNDFSPKECFLWDGPSANGSPCVYLFGTRIYVRTLQLKYLDIPKDDLTTKSTCKCAKCVNPYHFTYVNGKNAKLSCGDRKLLLAYRGHGAPVGQIAEALKVHRSTIYRHLNYERLSSRIEGD